MRSPLLVSISCSASLIAVAALPSAALAQPAAGSSEQPQPPATESSVAAAEADAGDIVVTGSRIPRPNFESIQPAVVLDAQQIEARGFETLGQALNEQPAFGPPDSSQVGAQSNFGPGQSFVNFLGLGSERTLVLVNGRRFVGSNTASIFGPTGQGGSQVDLNLIPTKLIERVETIVIGGAPIYGSDAIAGTVNVVLRRDFEGIELDAQYGISSRGDAANYRVRGLAGFNFAGGRGNITVAGEYNEGEGLVGEDRPDLYTGGFFAPANNPASPFSNVIFQDRRIPALSQFGIPTRFDFYVLSPEQRAAFLPPGYPNAAFTDAQGRSLRFDSGGNLVPIVFGQPTGPIGPNGLPGSFNIDFSGGDGFNPVSTINLLTDTERYSANALLSFEVSDGIRLFGEGWYSHSSAVNLRGQPENNAYLFGTEGTPSGSIIVRTDNPFLSDQARAIIQAQAMGGTFRLQRSNSDLTTGRAVGTVEVQRFVGGLDGTFSGPTGHEWRFELVGNYGRSETNGEIPSIVTQNFRNAVDAVRDSSGNIICRPGFTSSPIATLSSACQPLNLFGSRVSQAAIDYVTTIARPVSINEQRVFTASVTGPLFTLPGGDLSFALGYEHREESQDFDPGAFLAGAPDPNPLTDTNGNGNPADDRVSFGQRALAQPVSGEFSTDEVFGELRAALIGPDNDVPLIHSLELQGAARYVEHSVAGGDLTWTVGASWQPVRDILLRGNFTRAIRAPFITEAFNPTSSFFGLAVDPCDRTQVGNGPDPAPRRANCLAAGIPATFSSLSGSAGFLQSIAGNPDLSNETSDAFTVGAVIRPERLPGFSLSADYVDIQVRDVITQFGASQVVAACFDSPDFPNNDFCDLFTRAANNQLNFVETGFFNAASLRYKGVLVALDYRVDTPFLGAGSGVGVNASYQYLDTLSSQADQSSPTLSTEGSLGYAQHQALVSLSYRNAAFSAFTQLNYQGKAAFDVNEADNFRTPSGVDESLFVNMGVAFAVNDRFALRLVVDNLFDAEPPFPVPTGGGTLVYFPGVLGRYLRAGVTVTF